MINKYPQNLIASHLPLSMLVLLSSISSNPLKAQAVDTTQLPTSTFILSQQQLPPPQDLQPSVPSPVPSPELPQPLPPPAELFPPSVPTPTPDEPLPGKFPQTIVVERFEVIGSTVFSPEELALATAEFTKRPISLTEVYQARSKITDLYVRNGYITSGAYIPPQTIKSGVVKIQVVEGKLEDIRVTGTRRLNPNYVRSRLAIATSQPLNRQRLLEALQLLQLNPLIQNVSAELSAGSRTGSSLLEVNVSEAKTFNSQIVLDNGRSPSVGSFRRRLQLNEANLLGLGDALGVAYTNTDGSNSLDANYTLPLNPRNGTLTFNYGITSSNVIEPPFDVLDIHSDSRYYELTFRQPIVQTPTQEFALGLTASRRESDISSLLQREGLPGSELSPGADEQGRTRVSALRFFQEWTSRNSREVIALRSQFSLGIDILSPTINQNAPDSRFFAWQGQAQWVRLLAPETLLLLRLNTQLASRTLLPIEQFGLGGQDSIRGYRQDYLLTDNGTFVSAEVQVPILRLPKIDSTLQVVPFVDFGVGWNSSDRENPNPNTLAAVGLGLRWSQGDRFTVRLDWGVPLISVGSNERTLQENGLYFSLLYSPF
ncbi:ShlB/FhaC/HecB family hemolysin secretion/activation protein [Nostoc sp. UCD121]|uniref:ShlB/FhaC/HecB family hemolysin secretion/activation protein n=1 Tax=unclassified Nostoc TaxID=2593658 RepID=UPI00162644DD|nr:MULTISPECIES: ShlB/FhaC/HecB family hemolysin secretion/activation protein [unclassified Nostoc]MBC1222746.1 ShlB/FhaC/HecB family hemolysin secretion/activation protein [Nostoc sp. UCD120]MBC1275781.1 ShlB/FhaC/HecB family hemolysin secretion/activation protein [Nostoc sp. UCD121]MBC1295229.1 ShlB/FhaC/HecB family hemolysin secretion/activation protein [Nostoc sp. UCD122]